MSQWYPSADDKLFSAAEMGGEGEEEDEEDFAVKIINKKGRLRWREGSERIFDWKEAGLWWHWNCSSMFPSFWRIPNGHENYRQKSLTSQKNRQQNGATTNDVSIQRK